MVCFCLSRELWDTCWQNSWFSDALSVCIFVSCSFSNFQRYNFILWCLLWWFAVLIVGISLGSKSCYICLLLKPCWILLLSQFLLQWQGPSGSRGFTISPCGVLVMLGGVSPFTGMCLGSLHLPSFLKDIAFSLWFFSSKSKQCIFNYWIPSEGERTACKHHFFFIVELDNKNWKYFEGLKIPLCPWRFLWFL